jgi:hypothetical protein
MLQCVRCGCSAVGAGASFRACWGSHEYVLSLNTTTRALLTELSGSGTFALIWSTIELNVAIICASVLVMKPLFARFIPAVVSEQPISAREDARLFRGLTGVGFLLDTEAGEAGETGETEEKQEEHDGGRRDTAVAFNVPRVAAPGRIWDPRRGLRGVRRSW